MTAALLATMALVALIACMDWHDTFHGGRRP